MVLSIAKEAVNIKCGFENAKMVGNYECAYALGILNANINCDKITDYENIADLKEKVFAHAENYKTEDKKMKQMVCILREYEPSQLFDEQMKQLFDMGFDDNKLK